MKVFFDGKILTPQMPGGINREVLELLKAFNAISEIEKIYYRGLYVGQSHLEREWFTRYYQLRVPLFLNQRIFNVLDTLGMEMAYGLEGAQNVIYHAFYYRVPKKPKGPVVVDVHDMIQELFTNNQKVKAYKKRAFQAANLIIANSEYTKQDLCRIYPIDPKKVIIGYRGISEAFLQDHGNNPSPNQRSYMLYVGARNPTYKNFNVLLDVFINKKYFLEFDLVCMGGEEGFTPHQKEKAKKASGTADWLIRKSGNDETLANLYAHAAVFIYPSTYEGFGVPLIEAMACGCPVAASNATCIPEIVGDAALLFDPKNPEDLAQAIEKIISDKNAGAELIEKGKTRANQFSWQKMAQVVYQGYKDYCN